MKKIDLSRTVIGGYSSGFIGNRENIKHPPYTKVNIGPNKIRLIFVAYTKHKNYFTNKIKYETTQYISRVYNLPKYMDIKQACKVVSNLTDVVESGCIKEASIQSVQAVDSILERWGFVPEDAHNYQHGYYHSTGNGPNHPKIREEKGVVDLITYDGTELDLMNADLYDRYFNWYTEGVTEEEFNKIYEEIKFYNQDKGQTF